MMKLILTTDIGKAVFTSEECQVGDSWWSSSGVHEGEDLNFDL
ncbi:unnamed protein product [Camellia sinensis]